MEAVAVARVKRQQVNHPPASQMSGVDLAPLEGAAEDLERLRQRDPTDAFDLCPGNGRPPLSQSQRLMLSVVERAANDIVTGIRSPSSSQTNRLAAMEWMASNTSEWPFSFVRICYGLSLEPDWVRKKIARRLERERSGEGHRKGRGLRW